MADAFPRVARDTFSPLIDECGFHLVAEDEHHIRLESNVMAIEAWYDTRGELDVDVFRLDSTDRHARWTYVGMVGNASTARLLEIAVEKMTADPAILTGDPAFYDRLAAESHRLSDAWTAYYSRKGPRPTTGRLPQ